ncbi:hypothetical protein PoB_001438100 [Plakobranchus ocellatus]|uniref:Uncharacterized protein n=1 Tax=Plakobranchus ocellatus TaxID=259542 RepID=A0AAV3YKS6_9GAST|nr:hypothetical protein PoB_001438100 [Plakobranchus ocellatus]
MGVEVYQQEKRLRKLLKEFNRESFETGVLGGRYREQTVRVFSRLIVTAATCRPVFRTISEKRVSFLMRRTASPPGDPQKQSVTPGWQLPLPKPAFLQGHNSRLRSIQQYLQFFKVAPNTANVSLSHSIHHHRLFVAWQATLWLARQAFDLFWLLNLLRHNGPRG